MLIFLPQIEKRQKKWNGSRNVVAEPIALSTVMHLTLNILLLLILSLNKQKKNILKLLNQNWKSTKSKKKRKMFKDIET